MPKAFHTVQATGRVHPANSFRGAQYYPSLLFPNIYVYVRRCFPESILQSIRRTRFHESDHVLPFDPAGISVILLKKIRFNMQRLKLQFGKSSVADQPITAAEGRSNQRIRQL